MKILKILSVLLLCACSLEGQAFRSYTATTTGPDAITVKTQGTNVIYHKLSWTTKGTVSGCSVKLEQSVNNTVWTDLIPAQTCTSNGYYSGITSVVNYVRINVTIFAGTSSPALVVSYTGNDGTGAGVQRGDTLPANPVIGDVFFKTNASGGAVDLYKCLVNGAWTAVGVASGSGTVTTLSAGSLAPVFTTTVTNNSTQPNVTFALNSQAPKVILMGPTSGANAAPTFRTLTLSDLPTIKVSDLTRDNIPVGAFYLDVSEISAPANPSTGTCRVFVDSTTHQFTFKNSTGASCIAGATGVAWGGLTGSIANQTDLANALGLKANISSLANVATTGSYSDLTNPPTLPQTQAGGTNLWIKTFTSGTGAFTTAQPGFSNLSGNPTAAQLSGAGTPNNTTVLYGDLQWRTPPGASGGLFTATNNSSASAGSKAVSGTCTYKVNTSDQWEADCPIKSGGTSIPDSFTAIADPGTCSVGDFWYSSTTAGKFKFCDGAIKTIASLSDNITGTAAGLTGLTLQGTGTAVPKATGATTSGKQLTYDANGNIIASGYDTGSGGAPVDSPTFTGDPKAPTVTTADSDNSLATTAFVHNVVSGVAASGCTAGTPATANATGAAGACQYDASYFYTATGTNTWRRVAWDAGWLTNVAVPTYNNDTGTYNNDVAVTVSDATSGSTICYTTNGSDPAAVSAGTCSTGTTYTVPVNITATATTLKALGTKAGSTNSTIKSGVFTLTAATPTHTPDTGSYSSTQNVTIATATTGSPVLKYCTDAINTCDPSVGTTYSVPVAISATGYLRSIASKTNYVSSSVKSSLYTITGSGATSQFSVLQLAAGRSVGTSTLIINTSVAGGDYGANCYSMVTVGNCNGIALTSIGANHGIIVALMGQDHNNSIISCTDSASNTYTRVPGVAASSASGSVGSMFSDVFYLNSSTVGTTSVTCTLNAASNGDANITVYELNQPITGVDATASMSNGATNPTYSGPAISTTGKNAHDFIIANNATASHLTSAVSSPWVAYTTALGPVVTQPYIATTTTGTWTPTWTDGGTSNEGSYSVSVVAFK